MAGDLSSKQAGKRPQVSEGSPNNPSSFNKPSCPRCSSEHTKFCRFNNNSFSKLHFFCKNCRLYWTYNVADISAEPSWKRARADVLAYHTSSGLCSNLDPQTCLSPVSATTQTNGHAYGCSMVTKMVVEQNGTVVRVHPLPSLFSHLTLNDSHSQQPTPQSAVWSGKRMPDNIPTTNGKRPTLDNDSVNNNN